MDFSVAATRLEFFFSVSVGWHPEPSTQIVLHEMHPDILDSNDRYDPALDRLKARSADISIASGVNRWKGSP